MKTLAVFDNVSLELLAVFRVEVVLEKLFSFDSVFVKTFPCCEVALGLLVGEVVMKTLGGFDAVFLECCSSCSFSKDDLTLIFQFIK